MKTEKQGRDRKKSIILLSGGLDSAANLAICSDVDDPVLSITVDYGQRAAKSEIRASRSLSEYYSVPHKVVNLDWLGKMGGNALTDSCLEIPRVKQNHLDDFQKSSKTARAVWVPNRNGILINLAAAFAESLEANYVVVGFNSEEAATFPDNSSEFIKRITDGLSFSTANAVEVFSYTDKLDKTEIVRKLLELKRKFPFEFLWSCYRGDDVPCGECESCQRLDRALEKAGIRVRR